MIYSRYPKTEKERTCNVEKDRLNGLRNAYRVRIEAGNTGGIIEPEASAIDESV